MTLGGSRSSPEPLSLVRCRPGLASPAGHTAVRLWPVFQRGSSRWALNIKTAREKHWEWGSWLPGIEGGAYCNLLLNFLNISVWFRRSCNSGGINNGENAACRLWSLRKWWWRLLAFNVMHCTWFMSMGWLHPSPKEEVVMLHTSPT